MSGLYFLALERLRKLEKTKNNIIRFPKVFQSLCCSFQISKKEAWEILFVLHDLRFVRIVPCQGIRIDHVGDSDSK